MNQHIVNDYQGIIASYQDPDVKMWRKMEMLLDLITPLDVESVEEVVAEVFEK